MPTRIVLAATIASFLLLFFACEDAPQPSSLSPYTGYLEEEIPPCTPIPGSLVDPCEPRGAIETFGYPNGHNPAFQAEEPQTIRLFLDTSVLTFIPHVVLRGTYIPNTVRCTSGDPNRTPSYVEQWHSILFNCYADVRVNEYVLGDGPARLTVLVSFHHYWDGYYSEVAEQENITEEEWVERFRTIHVLILEQGYDPDKGDEPIYGREVILFVGPPHSEAHEVWEVFTTWNVERRDDATVVAVHPHRDGWRGSRPDKYREHRADLELELPRFKEEVLAAHQARVEEYGGRIASVDNPDRVGGVELPSLISDIHDLDEFLVSTGAYDHPDGTPVPPPPVP